MKNNEKAGKRMISVINSKFLKALLIFQLLLPGQVFTQSYSNYQKREVYIRMRDGIKLFTSIYSPVDTTKDYPIMILRTPYDSEPNGENSFNDYLVNYEIYINEGYILVFQDVRGRFLSEGVFEDVRPFIKNKKSTTETDESTDTYDTVDWLVKNVPYNNGKVGIKGVSYPGFYSTMAILSNHPAIKAVSPQAPVTSWFLGDDWHHNGAFFLLDCFYFYHAFMKRIPGPTRIDNKDFDFPVMDNYSFFMKAGTLKEIKTRYFGDSIKFWNDAFKHPDYDQFWKERDPLPHLVNIQPAVLTVGGWFDAEDLYGTLHTYKAIEIQNPAKHPNFLIMGPWFHGQWRKGKAENLGDIYWGQDANTYFNELELRFFDYYLKGKGTPEFIEANVFVTGENKWQKFGSWPPSNISENTLYFQPSGGLSFDKPIKEVSFDEYVADPDKPVPYYESAHMQRIKEYMVADQSFAGKRQDVIVYQTEILSDDITITGPVIADLFVSTNATDADYVVKIIDVFPDNFKVKNNQGNIVNLGGYQMLIRAEVMRGRYRNSFEMPEPIVPEKITPIKYELPDIAHTFKKGHRIMVQVQNSWFPLVDRNPQKFVKIYSCTTNDFQKAAHRIYHDKNHLSGIRVKILSNGIQ